MNFSFPLIIDSVPHYTTSILVFVCVYDPENWTQEYSTSELCPQTLLLIFILRQVLLSCQADLQRVNFLPQPLE